MSEKKVLNGIDILLMSDNGLETVGGEQESTKIIINGIKDYYTLGVIQPGNIKNPLSGVYYYPLTEQTRIKHLIKKPISFLKYIWDVMKVIQLEKPKIIHTQAQVSFFIVSLLIKFKFISKKFQFIHTERGLYTKYSSTIKKTFLFFMRELDVLVTTTNFNKQYWKESIRKKKLPIKLKIIENTAGELFESYNHRYEKNNNNQLVLGFAGRYADWKNWPLAVELSQRLNEELGENLSVNMAVGCLDYNAEEQTKKMFKELTRLMENRFKGKINISLVEMEQFYYDIDIFILTSDYNTESFGRTLIEAMSRKTVVLTTEAGGSVEVVGNPDNVCTTVEQFVSRVLDMYYDEDKMKQIKEQNMIRVKEKYSLDNNIKKHFKLYKNHFNGDDLS